MLIFSLVSGSLMLVHNYLFLDNKKSPKEGSEMFVFDAI